MSHFCRAEMSYFPLQINFSVDVDRVYGGVSGPCSDGVDIDARAKQVRSSRVPDDVRAHKLTLARFGCALDCLE